MISVIVAIAQNGVIGCDNRLLWHISEDLRRFKAITSGHPVIMGRKTYESLGRPLPNRTNVIVTRKEDYKANGCVVVNSLKSACYDLFTPEEEVFVIGGGEIYTQAMEFADRFYLTVVHKDYQGDTVFPAWDKEQWQEISREYHDRGEKFESPYEFIDYERIR